MNVQKLALSIAVAGALVAGGCGQKPQPAPTSEAAPAGGAQPGAPPADSVAPAPPPAAAPAERRQRSQVASRESSPLTPAAPERKEPPAPKITSITLPEGTTLRVRTTSALSTKTATAGEGFTASLMSDLVEDGVTVAPRGATVRGKVVDADPGGRVKGRASISVRLTELETINGMIPIATNTVGRVAEATKKKDALKVGIGSGLGAAIGAIAGGGKGAAIGAAAGGGAGGATVLATRGDAAVIAAESPLTFRLTAPAKVR